MRAAALALGLVTAGAALAATVERRIDVTRPGPQRLDVDLALLSGSRANLDDLRIYDGSNREVPYLLVPPPTGQPRWIPARRFAIAPTKTSSGFEADGGSPRRIDGIRVTGIAPPFLKRVRVEGSGDRQRWTVLAEATVFDLPHQQLSRTVVEFDPSDIRYVRLTWDDSSSARVGGSVQFRLHGPTAPPQPLRSTLTAQKKLSEPGISRYQIRLPSAGLPLRAIEIPVEGDVFRSVKVTEPRLDVHHEIRPFELGSGQIKQATRDGVVAADVRIPIGRAESSELNLVIDDADNDPLAIERVIVELEPQPWVYFEAPSAGSYVARYGDEKAQKPRYDLEAARSLIARSTPAAASWGPARTADQRPVEPAAHPLTGAAVDVTRFTVQRRIAPAGRGMSTLDLDADALARSRALADVRLVDSSGRQVPYVIERQDEPLALSLSLGPRRELPDNESAYTVRMPYTTLPSGTRLVITTPAGVFEREVRLLEPGEGSRDARLIGSRSWRHAEPDHAPPALSFDLPERISRQIELRISEGDNAPLTIRSAKLFMPAHALRFHHPGSALTLLYGNSEVGPPRYDLALLAPRIYREPAQRVYFATAINPGSEKESGVERHFFWIVIGGVALVLMLLLARLLSGLSPR